MSPTAVNDEITASVTDNTGAKITSGVTYSWKVGDNTISNTTATYTVKEADAGKTITVSAKVGDVDATSATATVKAATPATDKFTVTLNASGLPTGWTAKIIDDENKDLANGSEVAKNDKIKVQVVKSNANVSNATWANYNVKLVDQNNKTVNLSLDGRTGGISSEVTVTKATTLTLTCEVKSTVNLTLTGEMATATVKANNETITGSGNGTTMVFTVNSGDKIVISKAAGTNFKVGAKLFTEEIDATAPTLTEAQIKGVLGTVVTGASVSFEMPGDSLSLGDKNLAAVYALHVDKDVSLVKATANSSSTAISEALKMDDTDTNNSGGTVYYFTSIGAAAAPQDLYVTSNKTVANNVVAISATEYAKAKPTIGLATGATSGLAKATGETAAASTGVELDLGGAMADDWYLKPASQVSGITGNIGLGNNKFTVANTNYVPVGTTIKLTYDASQKGGTGIIALTGTDLTGEAVTEVTVGAKDVTVADAVKVTGEGLHLRVKSGAFNATEATAKTEGAEFTSGSYVKADAYVYAYVDSDKGTNVIAVDQGTGSKISATGAYFATHRTNNILAVAKAVDLGATNTPVNVILTPAVKVTAVTGITLNTEVKSTGVDKATPTPTPVAITDGSYVTVGKTITAVIDKAVTSTVVTSASNKLDVTTLQAQDGVLDGYYNATMNTKDVVFELTTTNPEANIVYVTVTENGGETTLLERKAVNVNELAATGITTGDYVGALMKWLGVSGVTKDNSTNLAGKFYHVEGTKADNSAVTNNSFYANTSVAEIVTDLDDAKGGGEVAIDFGYVSVTMTDAGAGTVNAVKVGSTATYTMKLWDTGNAYVDGNSSAGYTTGTARYVLPGATLTMTITGSAAATAKSAAAAETIATVSAGATIETPVATEGTNWTLSVSGQNLQAKSAAATAELSGALTVSIKVGSANVTIAIPADVSEA